MPLINVDAKALEWYCAMYLSKDKVGYKEILNDFDIHSHNQSDLALPDRLTAKKFVFRLIFGGSAWSYANDPDFMFISESEKYWQKRIDLFYGKYKDFNQWHTDIVREVAKNLTLTVITGRQYEFEYEKGGKLPIRKIYNYPVQGLGADLMAIARVSLHKRIKHEGLNSRLICTVHDSILVDSPSEEVAKVCELIHSVWRDIPRNFESLFKVKWDLPLKCEIEIGPNWGDMVPEKDYLIEI